MADEQRNPGGAAEGRKEESNQNAESQQLDQQLTRDLDQLRDELEAARNRELRAIAELDNYRKRITRQVEDERRYANIPFLRDLLPVLDNLKRATEAAEKSHDAASLLEGVQMVLKQFYTILQKHHCMPIEATGKPFDPHFHDAIMQQPSSEVPANTVLHEVQPGFQLHDRVVRPSQVIVSKAPEAQMASQGEGGDGKK